MGTKFLLYFPALLHRQRRREEKRRERGDVGVTFEPEESVTATPAEVQGPSALCCLSDHCVCVPVELWPNRPGSLPSQVCAEGAQPRVLMKQPPEPLLSKPAFIWPLVRLWVSFESSSGSDL